MFIVRLKNMKNCVTMSQLWESESIMKKLKIIDRIRNSSGKVVKYVAEYDGSVHDGLLSGAAVVLRGADLTWQYATDRVTLAYCQG